MTNHQPPTRDDIGRVFIHGTTVRVVLLAINPADGSEYDVLVQVDDETARAQQEFTRAWVDFRNLIATDERSGRVRL